MENEEVIINGTVYVPKEKTIDRDLLKRWLDAKIAVIAINSVITGCNRPGGVP